MIEDINTIQKINSTSKELKSFGFADTMQDSMMQARNIHLSEEEQDSSTIFPSQDGALEALSFNFKKYKDAADSRMKEMSEKVSELQEYVKQLLQRQSSTQQASSMASEAPQESPRQEEPQPVVQESAQHPKQETLSEPAVQEPIQQPRQEAPKQEKPYYEKQGNFTPDDVKIENIFYYGNK